MIMIQYFDGRCWTVVFGFKYGMKEAKALRLEDAKSLAERWQKSQVLWEIGRPSNAR